jgi:hypothetical protein
MRYVDIAISGETWSVLHNAPAVRVQACSGPRITLVPLIEEP